MTSVFLGVVSAALVAAVLHTLAGPDHYVPFIVLAQTKKWGLVRTAFWTLLCGLGHIATALVVVAGFFCLGSWLDAKSLATFESLRGSIAAWLLIVCGGSYALWGLHRSWRERRHSHIHEHKNDDKAHEHIHRHSCSEHRHWHEKPTNTSAIPWILFIIFAFGPCEVLLPLLVAAAVVGSACVIVTTVVFSLVTLATMLLVVLLGVRGMRLLDLSFWDRYAHALGGLAIMLCGLAIVCLGL